MKPVARVDTKTTFSNYTTIQSDELYLSNYEPLGTNGLVLGAELYTADQLRAAQVAVLREAADYANRIKDRRVMYFHLHRMADELEKSKNDPPSKT